MESEVEGDCGEGASEDAAIVNLQCSNGVIGSVVLSGVSQGRGNRLSWEITCQNGNIWWNEEENNVLSIAKKGQGICQKMFAFGNGFSDTFATLIKSFYMCWEIINHTKHIHLLMRGQRFAEYVMLFMTVRKMLQNG